MAKPLALDSADTVLDALCGSLVAKVAYNENEQVAPAAVLWTDAKKEWLAVAPRLRERLSGFLTLGECDPDLQQGPAIWIRERLVQNPTSSDAPPEVAVIYLPGVSRQQLRAVENCPRELQPIAELQYRGELWNQAGGIDWTINAFLQSKHGGLALDVAADEATKEAMRRAVEALVDTPVGDLRGRRLEAPDFDALLSGDTIRDLLVWMSDPAKTRQGWKADRWGAFRSRCQKDFGFDPETDGELAAAEHLAARKAPWDEVWRRFAEAPDRFDGVAARLHAVAPSDLFLDGEVWPQTNETAEDSLRSALCDLEGRVADEARKRVGQLEEEHGFRREWVWARMGQAPLARALAHVDTIAVLGESIPAFPSVEEAAEYYASTGWKLDDAALAALQCVRKKDLKAVSAALRALYLPWLEETALRFQNLVAQTEFPRSEDVEAGEGVCLLFADGLRYDVARQLDRRLRQSGREVSVTSRFASLPSVTSTCKPATSPIAALVSGTLQNEDFQPEVAASGKPLTTSNFRKLLGEHNCQVLMDEDVGDPSGRGWTEAGALDRHGHDEGWKLAWRIEEELEEIEERVTELLAAGWKEVRIVTDHGWLLMPGKLPATKLPGYLAKTRWKRCATLKEGSKYDGPIVPWRWCDDVAIALAPGVSLFFADEYSHGGLSLQECVTPLLTVTTGVPAVVSSIEDSVWRGLRCRVAVLGATPGMTVDLRTKAAVAGSSVVADKEPKAIDANGAASLLVEQDDLLGTAASLVLLDADARVVVKRPTTIGGEI